ncbi:hypothetical protein B0H10DRAFT_1365027 [Mycena sp. CBHHK59/15]|nr:hypothetical protein B0H10DRAFT_1365027 [Mycena sp. CBHHK59/15]
MATTTQTDALASVTALAPIRLTCSTIPISTVPTEILREIFIRCVRFRYPHIQPFTSFEAPLLFCGVCALWRGIAIAMPQLWSQLSVSIDREIAATLQPSLQLIEIWIERSGVQPLTLVLQDLESRSSSADLTNDLLRIFVPHMHRWQSITLFLPNDTFPEPLTSLEIPQGGAPLLQTAKFEFGVDGGLETADTPQIAGLSKILSSSTHLHTLYWRNDLSILLQLFAVPWAQLTVIDLVPMWRPMSQIVRVMQEAPKLRSLSVFITEACDVAPILFLPDLIVLWIGAEVDVGPLFRRLTLPSLRNLNVFCSSLEPAVRQTDVTDCMIRSKSPIDTAILKSLRTPRSELHAFLRASPSLLLFEISNDGEATITDETLTLLTAGNTTPCLCPNLRIIRFLESSISSTDGRLADMVASRREVFPAVWPVGLLSRLVVEFSEAELLRHTEDSRRLQGMGKAGLKVWVNEAETE